jgi:hypothetical protein
MKRLFDPKAAAQGGAGVLIATALVLGGLMVLLELGESRVAWGVYLVLCGMSVAFGMSWFGLRTVTDDDKKQDPR